MKALLLTTLVLGIGMTDSLNAETSNINDERQTKLQAMHSDGEMKRSQERAVGGDLSPDNTKEDSPQKRMFGHLLGNGYATGKRAEHTDIKRPYGWAIGRGLFSKKRDGETFEDDLAAVDIDGPVDDDEKKWVGDVFGGGYFKKRSKRDIPDKRYIRYFGHMLGRGYAFGKRNDDNLYMDDDMFPYSEDEDDVYPIAADPNDIDDIYEEDEDEYSSPEQINTDGGPDEDLLLRKRYFNSDPGYRFMFGKKRNGNRYQRKRFGYILGNGFAFGKRSLNLADDENSNMYASEMPDLPEIEKRIGLVLGKGYRLGSPSRRSWVFSQGYPLGKRSSELAQGSEENDVIPASEMFVDDMGSIQTPVKRFVFSQGYRFSKAHPKRFGYILGSGFRLGKRDNALSVSSDRGTGTEKRFGFILGRGYRFGKRMNYRNRFGNILGSGFAFGKREESTDPEMATTQNEQ